MFLDNVVHGNGQHQYVGRAPDLIAPGMGDMENEPDKRKGEQWS